MPIEGIIFISAFCSLPLVALLLDGERIIKRHIARKRREEYRRKEATRTVSRIMQLRDALANAEEIPGAELERYIARCDRCLRALRSRG